MEQFKINIYDDDQELRRIRNVLDNKYPPYRDRYGYKDQERFVPISEVTELLLHWTKEYRRILQNNQDAMMDYMATNTSHSTMIGKCTRIHVDGPCNGYPRKECPQ